MRGKDLFERAYYLNEEIDENSFEEGCKWGVMYREYAAVKASKQKKPNFNEAYNNALSKFSEEVTTKTAPSFEFKAPSMRRRISYRVNTVSSLLDALEDEFNFHPSQLTPDDYQRLNKRTEDIKSFAKSFIKDTHVPSSDRILDKILRKNNGVDIVNYLYQMIF